MQFHHVAIDIHQQTAIVPIPLAVSPGQASASWTILFTSSANLLKLQLTSRKCPKSNIFWNWTKKSPIFLHPQSAYGLCCSIANLDIIPFGTWKRQNQPSYEYYFIATWALRVCRFSTLFHSSKHDLLSAISFTRTSPWGGTCFLPLPPWIRSCLPAAESRKSAVNCTWTSLQRVLGTLSWAARLPLHAIHCAWAAWAFMRRLPER